mmetsp:Transcript_22736/g.31817  ORF Transcript_22736/g.31817 Transcript_22736/m.31817 type:complete len:88 (-) Transcript_22736:945-1208(-)
MHTRTHIRTLHTVDKVLMEPSTGSGTMWYGNGCYPKSVTKYRCKDVFPILLPPSPPRRHVIHGNVLLDEVTPSLKCHCTLCNNDNKD